MLQIELPVTGVQLCERNQVAQAIEEVIEEFRLTPMQRTTLSTKPGSLHWHVRQANEKKGVLEVTYWPKTGQVWVEVHDNRQQLWNLAVASPFSNRLTEALMKLSAALPSLRES